jgi:hypothetical protein
MEQNHHVTRLMLTLNIQNQIWIQAIKKVSAISVYDDEFEDGTTDRPWPFTVHCLNSEICLWTG